MAEKLKSEVIDVGGEEERKWFLVTFIKFTDKKISLSLLSDCVEDKNLKDTVIKHESNGYREITGSRSTSRSVKEKESISVTYGGELQVIKNVSKSTIKVGKDFTTTSVTVATKINKNANFCIIHYLGTKGCEAHTVLFSVNEEYKLMSRPKMWKASDHESQKEGTGSVPERKFKLSKVGFEERDAFLQMFKLKRYQFLTSSVFRSDEEEEEEVTVSTDTHQKMHSVETIFTYFFFILRDEELKVVPASFVEDVRSVKGKVHPHDVFCAVAEFTAERKTLGKSGGSFISEKDNRIQVQIPEGALDTATEFTFRLELVDLDRYRVYGEQLPDIFKTLVGFPTSLSIEHEMKRPLKENAKIYLPVIGDGEEKDILFVHWNGDKATPLSHKVDSSLPETPYYVEVDKFSTISAQTKKPDTTIQDIINATRLLMGQTSICIILTYIVPNYIRGMPGILIDCVEMHRVKTVTKEYVEEGYIELPGSRSKDCLLEEGGYVSVDVGGNLQLELGIRRKDLRVRFFRNTSTSRIMVPVKFKNSSQTLSMVVYTTCSRRWKHSVYFCVADYIVRDRLGRAATRLEVPETSSVPPVLSEKSLSALGGALPDSTWHAVGLELDMTHDKITAILEDKKDSSGAGFRLLKEWLQSNARLPSETLTASLINSLSEIGREDVAEIVRNAKDTNQCIRRANFGGRASHEVKGQTQPRSHCGSDSTPKPFK